MRSVPAAERYGAPKKTLNIAPAISGQRMLVVVTDAGEQEGFIRFVVPAISDEDSQTAIGVILFAYRLAEAAETPDAVRRELNASLKWLEASLPVPDRFNRTRSKGWYRRQTRGISWLREVAV